MIECFFKVGLAAKKFRSRYYNMKNLYFNIQYRTNWGEHIELYYSIDGEKPKKHKLNTKDGCKWETTLQLADDARHIRHTYICVDDNGKVLRTESNNWRLFYFNHRTNLVFTDAWAEHALDTIYQRTAFEKCIMLPRGADELHMEHLTDNYLLQVHALPPIEGLKWGVVGNTKDWGEWDIQKALPMRRTGTYEWTVSLNKSDFENGFEYKYVLIDSINPANNVWEEGENRSIQAQKLPVSASVIRQDELPRISCTPWKGAGCVIPVFSLRSEGSFGIGDFGDLKTCIRWAADTGLKAIQLLPINDTTREGTWRDSYPYNGISVFALHPIYLDAREWKKTLAYAKHEEAAKVLNQLQELDYEGVYKLKLAFLQDLYVEIGTAVIKGSGFKSFEESNAYWLRGYSEFCTYRDYFHTANFRRWPHQTGSESILAPDLSDKIYFHEFVQYLLHRQMLSAHTEARKLGVILKGDIPIGICPDSVPAWTQGRLFHFDGQAGAPPDDFAVHGQNWGFPTYNWDEMAKDGYKWWQQRLQHMEKYFDAYRIDHVLGFFRIWEIPSKHIYGVLGHFRPALPYSEKEIRDFGFTDDIDKYTFPYLSQAYFDEMCKLVGTRLKNVYFEKYGEGYTLRKGYRSQREVIQNVPEGTIRNLLLDLVAEVLFVVDAEHPNLYHPRISAQLTKVFGELSPENCDAYNRLYDHFFYVRHNQFWADEAMKKLPVITQSHDILEQTPNLYPLDNHSMLACAEDLGMVPASVKGVLERLQILSLEIQRMPKEYGVRFGYLEHNPYMSVSTIATHDMSPLRLWWKEDRRQTEDFWRDALGHEGDAPDEATPEICEEVVARHLASPSMLCLLALQDLLAVSPTLRSEYPEKEQINVPANPNHYWRYRMHLTLETLIQETAFNEKLRGLINRK